MESDSHGSADRMSVLEAVPPSDAPHHVRHAAEPVLARFGHAWGDVSEVARMAPASSHDAETWLVALRSDALRPGTLVQTMDGCWTAIASTQAVGSGETTILCEVHVVEKAHVER